MGLEASLPKRNKRSGGRKGRNEEGRERRDAVWFYGGKFEDYGRDALRLALLVCFCLLLFENLDLLKRYVGGLVVSMNNRRISAL